LILVVEVVNRQIVGFLSLLQGVRLGQQHAANHLYGLHCDKLHSINKSGLAAEDTIPFEGLGSI
jgi:hypothetical protein